jgi:hypothetical protein
MNDNERNNKIHELFAVSKREPSVNVYETDYHILGYDNDNTRGIVNNYYDTNPKSDAINSLSHLVNKGNSDSQARYKQRRQLLDYLNNRSYQIEKLEDDNE